MSLHPGQTRFFERFFPGLISSIRELGPGEFESKKPEVKTVGPNQLIRDIQLDLVFRLTDGPVLEIRTHSRLVSGDPIDPSGTDPVDLAKWERYRYALNYGPSFLQCFFRFDLDAVRGYHIHTDKEDHVPAQDVIPDTRNVDPREFVKIVAKYRKDKVHPVTRIRPGKPILAPRKKS